MARIQELSVLRIEEKKPSSEFKWGRGGTNSLLRGKGINQVPREERVQELSSRNLGLQKENT